MILHVSCHKVDDRSKIEHQANQGHEHAADSHRDQQTGAQSENGHDDADNEKKLDHVPRLAPRRIL